MKRVTVDSVKPKVLAGMYAIDVEPILPRNRNNREVYLDYLKHLKESVETLREIVEEARVKKPLDSSLASACLYTKRSRELLEYVIGTCPKDFNKRDKKIVTAPLTRRKQVTFKETCGTSNANIQKHVKPQEEKKTNVHVIPSTGVTSSTKASESKPRSNTKNNRILPAKNINKKKVEYHPMNNKSNLKHMNCVDSSISYKRTLTGKKFTLGVQCPLTRFTKSKVVPVKKPKNEKATSTGIPTIAETQTTDSSVKYTAVSANQQDPNRN
ncbi:hypothetical protein Tco_0277813 [Tanacetum coccineum]